MRIEKNKNTHNRHHIIVAMFPVDVTIYSSVYVIESCLFIVFVWLYIYIVMLVYYIYIYIYIRV